MKNLEQDTYLTFKIPEGYAKIPLLKISFIRIENAQIKLYGKNGDEKIMSETMKNLESNLKNYGFVRIHYNCIVNFRQELALSVKERTLTLSNKWTLPVAKNRMSTVKEQLLLGNHSLSTNKKQKNSPSNR